jgi:hypothetical protein
LHDFYLLFNGQGSFTTERLSAGDFYELNCGGFMKNSKNPLDSFITQNTFCSDEIRGWKQK